MLGEPSRGLELILCDLRPQPPHLRWAGRRGLVPWWRHHQVPKHPSPDLALASHPFRHLPPARKDNDRELRCVFVQKQERTRKSWQVVGTQLGLAWGRAVTSLPPVCPPPPLSLWSGWRGAPCRLKRKTLSLAGLPVRDSVCSPARCDWSGALSSVPSFAEP